MLSELIVVTVVVVGCVQHTRPTAGITTQEEVSR